MRDILILVDKIIAGFHFILPSLRTVALVLFSCLVNAGTSTLYIDEIRTLILGKDIYISGYPYNGELPEWKIIKRDEVSGYIDIEPASSGFKGDRATVISVEERRSFYNSSEKMRVDTFGDPIVDSSKKDPYVSIIVEIKNTGTLLRCNGYFNSLNGKSLLLASRSDEIKTQIDSFLENLIGNTVYKVAYTKLIDSNLTLDELFDETKRVQSIDYSTKNLTPLKIINAKFIENKNFLILKIEIPNGENRLLLGKYMEHNNPISSPISLSALDIFVQEKYPSRLSKKEIAAIKDGKIFIGMSEEALYLSIGFPEKTNNWGAGGRQLIYSGNNYVYLKGKTVRDWQSL